MATTLPSDINQAMTVVRYEMLKYLRGKKILVFIGLIALILGLLTLMPYLLGDSLSGDPRILMMTYMGFISIIMILVVTLFAADSLASEFEYRTGLLLFPRPIKREIMFAGKFMASYLVSAIMIGIFYISVYIISYVVTGEVVSEGYTSLGMALIYVLAATGFGFVLSAFMGRGSTASILLFATLLIIFPIIDVALMAADIEPFFSLTYSGDGAYYAVAGTESYTMFDFIPDLGTSAIVLFVWAILTTTIAVLKFKRREF